MELENLLVVVRRHCQCSSHKTDSPTRPGNEWQPLHAAECVSAAAATLPRRQRADVLPRNQLQSRDAIKVRERKNENNNNNFSSLA